MCPKIKFFGKNGIKTKFFEGKGSKKKIDLCEKLSFPKNGKKQSFFSGRVQKRNLKCNFLKERVIKTWKRVFLETMHFVANKYGKMGENALYLKKMCPKIMFLGKNGIKMKFFEVKNVLFWQKMGLKMPFFWKMG